MCFVDLQFNGDGRESPTQRFAKSARHYIRLTTLNEAKEANQREKGGIEGIVGAPGLEQLPIYPTSPHTQTMRLKIT